LGGERRDERPRLKREAYLIFQPESRRHDVLYL
jgi:hypothetical protein